MAEHSPEEVRAERKRQVALGERVDEAVGSFVQLERVCEAHMKAPGARPISPEAARFAQKDMLRYGPGRVGFWSLVARHIGDPAVVDG